jgi:cytochrome c-type biogenesis protein
VTGPTGWVALFGAGVASFLAPCVLPLVPVYLTVLLDGGSGDRRGWAFGRATAGFVGGFSLVFALLGALAGSAVVAPDLVRHGVARVGGALLLGLGALLLIGRMPAAWQRTWRLLPVLPRVGPVLRPALLGVAFGAAWTPCVGPLLGAALLLATQAGGALAGAGLLAAYAAGIGVPFVVAALALDSRPGLLVRLRAAGPVLGRVNAVLLVLLGALLVTDRASLLGSLTGSVTERLLHPAGPG